MQDHAQAHAPAEHAHAAVAGDETAAEPGQFSGRGAIPPVGKQFHEPPPSASDRAFGADDKHEHETVDHGTEGQIHIITEGGLRHLRESGAAGRHAAKILFDNPNAYIVLKAGQQMPEGWKGKGTLLYPSFHDFAKAAHAGRIPKSIDAVVYDNEHWDQTPPDEKANPGKYSKDFEELAHSMGLVFIAAPTRKFFRGDARYADIIDVQLQDREDHARSYENALEHDAKLAHHENPDIKVVGQITSNANHLDPNNTGNLGPGIHKAEEDVERGSHEVDGFWGYVYQQNRPSIRAGTTILKDLADKKRKGDKL